MKNQTNKNSPCKRLLSLQNTSLYLFGESLLFNNDNIQVWIVSSKEWCYAPLAKLKAPKSMFLWIFRMKQLLHSKQTLLVPSLYLLDLPTSVHTLLSLNCQHLWHGWGLSPVTQGHCGMDATSALPFFCCPRQILTHESLIEVSPGEPQTKPKR